ncbi:MAG: type I pullulanase [Candidatus Neomarinimicrobiota bacterium]
MLTLHYHRYDNLYTDWTLWTWCDHATQEITASSKDSFGVIFRLDLNAFPLQNEIGILPKFGNWTKKDDPNRYWNSTLPVEIWIVQGDESVYTEKPDTNPKIRKAFLDSSSEITLVFSNPVMKKLLSTIEPFVTTKDGKIVKPEKIIRSPAGEDSSDIVRLLGFPPFTLNQLPATVTVKGYSASPVFLRHFLDDKSFQSNEPLGAFYKPESTKFNIYAPGATAVILHLYDQPKGGQFTAHELNQGKNGVWSLVIKGDLKGKYYVYSVSGPDPAYDPKKEILDPYATCATTHDGRALIFDDKTAVAPSPVFPFRDAIIYEMHVRDFTIGENSGVFNKGKYLGFSEKGTTIPGTGISTGLDHLTELGINTVQILPIQDFEHDNLRNNYFWGYMTVNFNSPDGWYTTNEADASRISEFKQMISALHERGIKVILDVVYNHTAETSPQIHYNFNGLVPGFYYRQKSDGSYWNGSGCGNEMRTENPMVRRFILESLKYWVETYKVDGFRFDLMGLIDIETMQEIVKTLTAIKSDIFIYGEPWTSGETPIDPVIKGRQRHQGFAVFNDNFRDALKGPWFNTEPGYVQTGLNVEAVKAGIRGSIDDFAAEPSEVLNYVSCHDGRTLWDQLVASTSSSAMHTDTELKAMDKLAAFIIFTSQGVPFMHGGEEFLRTKFGSHNSYNQPDKINKIRWDYKQENQDIFDYYQGLIRIRKDHPMFRLSTAEEIRRNLTFFENLGLAVPPNCIAYRLQRGNSGDRWREVIVLINPNSKPETFKIPRGQWTLSVDHTHADPEIISPSKGTTKTVNSIYAMLLYRM